jgi:hypothetical protein
VSDLWSSTSLKDWRRALGSYEDVISRQGVTRLPELDRWYREDLPGAMHARRPPHVTLTELARLTEWKMARGVWRQPNLLRVRSNDAATVSKTTADALKQVPHPTAPIATIAGLDGVGPATASAVMAAAEPTVYPFFDELVAAQVPTLGRVAWTLGYYARYAVALRERAGVIATDWTPVMVERALWANVGGKAGERA